MRRRYIAPIATSPPPINTKVPGSGAALAFPTVKDRLLGNVTELPKPSVIESTPEILTLEPVAKLVLRIVVLKLPALNVNGIV